MRRKKEQQQQQEKKIESYKRYLHTRSDLQ